MQSFQDYLAELNLTIEYHEELNPKLWKNGNLDPAVRTALIKFAYAWADFAKIPRGLIQDIIFTGGCANYNYTPKSDIDVHLIVDRKRLGKEPKLVDEYLQDKKNLWTLTHDVKVHGYPLEPYAQDLTDKYPKDQGIFSLKRNKWLQKPIYKKQHKFQNDPHLKRKVEFYIQMIDRMIDHKMGPAAFERLKDKIKNMRMAAIARGGEFSFENLVFKELRNRGYIDKMNNYATKKKDQSLSLI